MLLQQRRGAAGRAAIGPVPGEAMPVRGLLYDAAWIGAALTTLYLDRASHRGTRVGPERLPGRILLPSNENSLVLAGVVGDYRELRPATALERHFRCLWSNSLGEGGGRRLAVVPDGCVDITWVDGELIVAGPDTAVAVTPLPSGGSVVGARFRPGAAHRWLGLPMTEIVGGREPLGTFWGGHAAEIAGRIADAASTAERLRAMELALCRRSGEVGLPPADMGFVFDALESGSPGSRMAVILERLDLSPRTLRRRCHEAFGYGPKTLDRILRFQRFLALARRARDSRLADLGVEAGYADQAHLTREVRRLAGFSPAEILAQYGG